MSMHSFVGVDKMIPTDRNEIDEILVDSKFNFPPRIERGSFGLPFITGSKMSSDVVDVR